MKILAKAGVLTTSLFLVLGCAPVFVGALSDGTVEFINKTDNQTTIELADSFRTRTFVVEPESVFRYGVLAANRSEEFSLTVYTNGEVAAHATFTIYDNYYNSSRRIYAFTFNRADAEPGEYTLRNEQNLRY